MDWENNFEWDPGDFYFALYFFFCIFLKIIFCVLQSKMVRKLIIIFFSMERNTPYTGTKIPSFWKYLWGKTSCLLKVSWFTGVQEMWITWLRCKRRKIMKLLNILWQDSKNFVATSLVPANVFSLIQPEASS